MEQTIIDKKEAIINICKRHHIKTLWVFGSAAVGHGIDGNKFSQKSDIDLLVEFTDILYDFDNFDPIANHLSLINEFQKLFNRKVDVISITAITNRHFRQHIDKQKKLIYAV